MVGALAFGVLWLRHSPRLILWVIIVTAAFAVVVARFDTDMRRKQEYAKAEAEARKVDFSKMRQQEAK